MHSLRRVEEVMIEQYSHEAYFLLELCKVKTRVGLLAVSCARGMQDTDRVVRDALYEQGQNVETE